MLTDKAELYIDIASFLLANEPEAGEIARRIVHDVVGNAGSVLPQYLRNVAGRCRELASALDEAALEETERMVGDG